MPIHKETRIRGTKIIGKLNDKVFKDFVKENISWLYGSKVYVTKMVLKREKHFIFLNIDYKYDVGLCKKGSMKIEFSDKLCTYNSLSNIKVYATAEWIRFYENVLNSEVKSEAEEPELINNK